MATNRFFSSNRNIVGMAAAIAGVLLAITGLAGIYWPVVIVGLYLAGVLVTPPDRVRLVSDGYAEASALRGELDAVLTTVKDNENRVPAPALERIQDIERTLENMLARPREVVSRRDDLLTDLQRLIQTDLPLAVQTYLNMPWWFAMAKHASEELTRQLDLLAEEAKQVASRFHQHDLNQQSDHGGYLDER